jgi:hypothetical protein
MCSICRSFASIRDSSSPHLQISVTLKPEQDRCSAINAQPGTPFVRLDAGHLVTAHKHSRTLRGSWELRAAVPQAAQGLYLDGVGG